MFTANQLDFIKKCAQQRKNQGEISVYILAKQLAADGFLWEGFTEQQLNIIKYCAEECKRQRSGEMSVYDMVNAWEYASKFIGEPLAIDFIEDLGSIVEPIDNKDGFRKVPIGIWDGWTWKEKASWERVPILLEMLLDSYYTGVLATDALDASTGDPHYRGWNKLSKTAQDQFYFEYEEIHPFFDGNGRSGKILYNYLNGTLDRPVMPPNFWNASNP